MRITFSEELSVDNSSLTGESEPVILTDECTNENEILETKNVAFFGTLVKAGSGEGIVFLCGDDTVIGKIANMTAGAVSEETPIAKEISRFVKLITIVALILGITFFAIGFIYYEVIDNIVFAIGIIVANVPEGLLATVTVSLTLTAKKMASK
jgi:sodium/potassium-transporting ATPase subunit alpha